jgi:hypothetical protein
MRASLSVTEILDDAEVAASRVMAPWGGLLALALLPLRMLQIHLLDRLGAFGAEAGAYGTHLRGIALAITAALLVALVARAVYVRACLLGLRTGAAPRREALRVGVSPLLTYVYLALVLEALFILTAVSCLTVPILCLLSGLAAAVSPLEARAGLVAPWRALARHLVQVRVLVALLAAFACALVIVFVNLMVVYHAGLWLARSFPGVTAGAWEGALSPTHRSFLLAVLAGTLVAVEPFWLATLTLFVQKSLARETGEDLRVEWARLRAAPEAAR